MENSDFTQLPAYELTDGVVAYPYQTPGGEIRTDLGLDWQSLAEAPTAAGGEL